MKRNNKGFTLVELIVVLVILAILAAILVPTLLGYIDRARSEKDYSTAQTLRVAAQAAIDQAYGDGVLADNTGTITSINAMTGQFKGEYADASADISANPSKKYSKIAYTLAGVDSKVQAFGFVYKNGIILKGYVQINGKFYELSGGSWTVDPTKTTAPTLPDPATL